MDVRNNNERVVEETSSESSISHNNNHNNYNNNNDPRADTDTGLVTVDSSFSAVPSDIAVTCQLASGQVCICESCEDVRTRMIKKKTIKKRSRSVGASVSPKKPKKDSSSSEGNGANDSPATSSTPSTVVAKSTSTSTSTSTSLMDQDVKMNKMTDACQTILECIGEDPNREGLVKTPNRWAKALLFMTQGYHQDADQLLNGAVFEENHDEMVVVRDIDIHSLCEHHMVPFTGRVHIGYIPNGKILGLSKLARIAEMYARRLQVQERLTRQIADAIVEAVEPLGVAVVVECTHFCMVMRGVQKVGASTVTSSVRGCFESNPKTRAEFFSIIQGQGMKMC